MNILVTAGGTVEPIDDVRSITNSGTGTLGSMIADEFLSFESVGRLLYISTKEAVKPKNRRAELLNIKSTSDLEKCVLDVVLNNHIDAVIHSMAVSDYTVRSVTDLSIMTEMLHYYNDVDKSGKEIKDYLLEQLDERCLRKGNGKISSQLDNPLILLERTPKVLPVFRKYCSDSIIVGFKLLSGRKKEELLNIAYDLLKANECDFVLANDLALIDDEVHKGHLIDREKNIVSYNNKKDIASGLTKAVMEKINNNCKCGRN